MRLTPLRAVFPIVSWGFIASLAIGLPLALLDIAANGYLREGMHNLALLSVRDRLNGSLLAAIALLAAGLLARVVVARMPERFRGALSDAPGSLVRTARPAAGLALVALSGALALGGILVLLFFLLGRADAIGRLFARHAEHLYRLDAAVALAGSALLALSLPGLAIGFALRDPDRAHRRARAAAEGLRRLLDSLAVRRAPRLLGPPATALVVALNGFLMVAARGNPPAGPNVLLISVDTLRADHLGLYGHRRDVSPNIDALGRSGIVYRRAFSQSPWTLPSMASMHTSLYPSEHGATSYRNRIPSRLTTLAEALKERGYATAAVVSHPFVGKAYGFAQGFDVFDQSGISGGDAITSPFLTERAIRYLSRFRERRLFLWVHYFDPHYSYIRHEEFGHASGYRGSLPSQLDLPFLMRRRDRLHPADIRYVTDVYDEEISFTDLHIGRLLAAFDALGLAERTLVVLTADHGEEFMERGGFGHGKKVYQELIHVPLIVAGPPVGDRRGTEVEDNVEVRGIARLILEACGIPGSGFTEGIAWAAEARRSGDAQAISEGGYAWGSDERRVSVIGEGVKLIRNLDDGSHELYDLEADPGETENLFGRNDGRWEAATMTLMETLQEFARKQALETGAVRLDAQSEDILRSLGYIP